MAFKTRIYSLDDAQAQARWQALWEDSPQRSSFSSLLYTSAAARAFGLQAEMHLVAGDQQDEAGAIVLWRQRGPYRQVVVPPFTQYSAIVLREPLAEADVHRRRSAFEALLAALEDRFAILSFFIAITDPRPALWRGWQVTPYYTYRLALQDGDVLPRWSSATRRTFRKHRSAYRFDVSSDTATHIIDQCRTSYQRHGRPLPADSVQLLQLTEHLHRNKQVHLCTVTPDGTTKPEGGLALLHDERMAHYWIAGSAPGPAMTVLLGHALPYLQTAGLQHFDFVGANTPSIAEFKRHFGPNLHPYFHLHKVTRTALRLLHGLRGK